MTFVVGRKQEMDCVICFDKLSDSSTVSLLQTCGHWSFHNSCLARWYAFCGSKKCPICNQECKYDKRKEMNAHTVKHIYDIFWDNWRKLQLCCSEHILKSTCLLYMFNQKYEKYGKYLLHSAQTKKPITFWIMKNKQLFACTLLVTRKENKIQIECKQFKNKEMFITT